MALLGPFSPSGGLNVRATGSVYGNTFGFENTPKDQAVAFSDCFPVYGVVVNRAGIFKANSSALSNTGILGMGAWIDPAQAATAANYPTLFVVSTGASKKLYSGVVNSTSNVTFSDVTGTATLTTGTGEPYQFASLNGKLVGTGGALQGDVPFVVTTYNGNAAPLGGTPPSANAITVANNFMFLGRDLSASSKFSRIRWSAASDPTTWPAASSLDFRANDGDIVTALSSFGEDLIIFKGRSMGRLSTTTTAASGTVTLGPLTTLSTSIGCLGVDMVDKLPDGRLIFMDSNFHVRIFDGSSNIIDVSDQVSPGPSIQPLLSLSAYLPAVGTTTGSLKVYPLQNQVWIHLINQNNANVVYNYVENTWSTQAPGVLLYGYIPQATPSSIYPGILIGSDNAGFVWVLEQTLVGPSNISGSNQTPSFTMTIPLTNGFVPRTILVPATQDAGGTVSVTLGYNGTMMGSSLTQIKATNNPLWHLFDVRQSINSGGRPIMLQVQIQSSASNFFNGFPFYISDEVMSNFS